MYTTQDLPVYIGLLVFLNLLLSSVQPLINVDIVTTIVFCFFVFGEGLLMLKSNKKIKN